MKKSLFIILIVTLMILTSCSNAETNIQAVAETSNPATATPTSTVVPTDTPEPTATPEPEPKTPKYIFILIGDGFGRGGMTLGEIFARLESEDMSKGAEWENFDYQSYVKAMGESASGGTAIASGVETEPSYIGRDIDGNMLYTIMDRAKENGMATGVITNSSLTDATPATFLGHTGNRYGSTKITLAFPESNVDYMAGGGLGTVVHENLGDSFDNIDSLGNTPKLEGPEEIVPTLIDMGYETYLGMNGALRMRAAIQSDSFKPEKSLCIYTNGIMPFEYYKYRKSNSTMYENVPTLVEMTEAGIQSLIQDEDGFVMMIEEALIDKCGHKFNQEMYLYEVDLLNQVLRHLMDFYNEHPDETLIILTADHETGNYAYNDELLNQWKSSTSFVWTDDGTQMANFVNSEWGLRSYDANLQTQINKSNANSYDSLQQNRKPLYATLTLDICAKYGTKIQSGQHSGQTVPLFVMGEFSNAFEGSEHIKEIPSTICEIMGWEALPEIIDK